MTTRVTFDTVRPQESTASIYNGTKARGIFSILLGCLSWMPLSFAAEAAPFQQYLNGDCASFPFCAIDFAVVPAGRRLDITNASCYLRTSADRDVYGLQLAVWQRATPQFTLIVQPQLVDILTASSEAVYSANHHVLAFAGAGQRFVAFVGLTSGTISQFACHISGQMQNVP